MHALTYDDIYGRITALVEREKTLKLELADIQEEKIRLRSQLNFSDGSQPRWLSELPPEFWYPSFYTAKLINTMAPNAGNNNVPPDIATWVQNNGFKEFLINTALGIGMVIVAMQIFFFIF